MIRNQEDLLEYILERFAKLEDRFNDPVNNNRPTLRQTLVGHMLELVILHEKVTGTQVMMKRYAEFVMKYSLGK